MKKFTSAVMAFVLAGAVTVSVSCESKEKKSENESSLSGDVLVGNEKPANMSNDDYQNAYVPNADLLPKDDENISIQICYDNSVWNSETGFDELYVVDRYIDALNKNDIEAVEACYYDGFLDHICKENELDSPEAFIKNYRETLAESLVDEFSIDFIEISNCQIIGDSEAESMFSTRDEALKNAFGDDIISKITDRKLLTIAGDSYFTSPDGSWGEITASLPEGIRFCVYTIDGKPYIF